MEYQHSSSSSSWSASHPASYPSIEIPELPSPSTSRHSIPHHPDNDFLAEFKSMNMHGMNQHQHNPVRSNSGSLVPLGHSNGNSQSSMDMDTLQQLKAGFVKMMATLERLEQRMQRVEQTTSQILKNQQEVFQVPFMSQTEIDQARNAAEQLERDSSVAKQLQAAYNKEVEVKKTLHVHGNSMMLYECPICGVRVNSNDLEVHVDNCLEEFSDDPKKEVQVQEVKKKMDQGFFSRFIKTSKKTETTKVTTTTSSNSSKDPQSATAPLLGDHEGMNANPGYYHPGFAYPPFSNNGQHPQMTMGGNNMQSHAPPMMMPMYMYPSYPATHMTTSLQE